MDEKFVYWIDPRDKPGLLLAMMRAFVSDSNDSYISFEGELRKLNFATLPGASPIGTKAVGFSSPSDFIIIPLTEQNLRDIWKELVAKDHLVRQGIIHVEITNHGKWVFGGYDNFHRECVKAYSGVSIEFLEKLRAMGLIRGYTKTMPKWKTHIWQAG
jgi:hypothetical protein